MSQMRNTLNYCFNCGAELIEPNQNFCIKCGTRLREREIAHNNYKKEYRKKYIKKEGESYNDYLERINSPIKDKIAIDDEIEMEKEAYINFDPWEDIRKNKINYPKSERDEEDEDIVTYPYKREVISEGMYGKPALSIQGNFIYEGMYGRPKYYIDGNIIREGNQFGRPAYRIDGNYIREGMFGRPKYYIDGDLIRENNQFGRVVGRRRK